MSSKSYEHQITLVLKETKIEKLGYPTDVKRNQL